MNSQLKVVLRPNNQITITSGSFPKKKQKVYSGFQQSLDKVDRYDIHGLAINMEVARAIYLAKISRSAKSPKPALDLMLKSQRSARPPRMRINKPKSFTRQSGQKLRECGAAMSIASAGRPESCREVTLTLPANTSEAMAAIAAYSGYAINRLIQPIRRRFGSDALWFFVWEYQKRGALHLHFAIYNSCEKSCKEMAEILIAQWHKILCDISVLADTCMFQRKNKKSCTIRSNHQNHTEPMRKDVSRYFSKYAGKEESKNNWYCQKYPVSRFWGSSQTIKNIIKENSLSFSVDYYANERAQEEKMEDIVTNVIEKLTIVSSSSYKFEIELRGSSRLNRYKDGRKIVVSGSKLPLASGERFIFYFEQSELQTAIELIKQEMGKS